MKRLLFTIFTLIFISSIAFAQDFTKDITTAKTSYSAGKLEDAHFALLQALQEIDIKIGQEVLKLLPLQIDTLKSNPKDDNVSGSSGYIGTSIHRTYGTVRGSEITIITNSPLIGSLNALLNSPLMGGMMSDGKTKIVKVQGYKARMEKTPMDNGTTNYAIDIPMNNSLITIKMNNSTDTQILDVANKLALGQIAKLIQ